MSDSVRFEDEDDFDHKSFPRGAATRVPSVAGDGFDNGSSSIELPQMSRGKTMLSPQDPSQKPSLWNRFILYMLAPFDYAPDTNLTNLYPAKYAVMRRDNYNSLAPWHRNKLDGRGSDFQKHEDIASPPKNGKSGSKAANSDAEKSYETSNGRYVTDVSLNDSPRIAATGASANVSTINITTPTVVEPQPSAVSPYLFHRLAGEFFGTLYIIVIRGSDATIES